MSRHVDESVLEKKGNTLLQLLPHVTSSNINSLRFENSEDFRVGRVSDAHEGRTVSGSHDDVILAIVGVVPHPDVVGLKTGPGIQRQLISINYCMRCKLRL